MSHSFDIPSRESCVLGPLIEKWADEKPDDVALIFENGLEWSWSDVLGQTRATAARMQQMGVGAGDHVLSWQPNNAEAVLTWFALNYLGAVYVPMNTAYKGLLLQNLIQLSDAKLMVCHANLAPRLNDIDLGPELQDVVVTHGECQLENVTAHSASALFGPADASDIGDDIQENGHHPSHPMYIIFTSGTTGPSKAVLSSYVQTFTTGAEAYDFLVGSDRMLVNLPLFHVGGTVLIAASITHGCSCVVVDSFSTDQFWPVIRKHQDHDDLPAGRNDAISAEASSRSRRQGTPAATCNYGTVERGRYRIGRSPWPQYAHGVQYDGGLFTIDVGY